MAVRNVDEIPDAELLDITVARIAENVATVVSDGWRLSPRATLLALGRVLAWLALEHVTTHPEQRAAIVMNLRSLASCVEVESGVGKPQ